MSKIERLKCDRCGSEKPWFQVKNTTAKIMFCAPGEYRASGGTRIDLCEDCYNKFVAFLETDNISMEI